MKNIFPFRDEMSNEQTDLLIKANKWLVDTKY